MASDDGKVWKRLEALQPEMVRPGLDRILTLLEELGAPHLACPTTVIAGTNGKGSTAAMLASIAKAAGLRAGCYTSPHLLDLEERLEVDQQPITREGLAHHLNVVLAAVDRLLAQGRLREPASHFETLTAVAFRYFAEARVDLAILEVGLGGRFDATNVTRPRLSVLTSIDVDHIDWLGDDLSDIAAEKFAIVPPASLAVVAPQPPEVLETIRREAAARGARLSEAQSFPLQIRQADERLRFTFDCIGGLRSYSGLQVGLAGRHQLENARCALLAAEALDRRRMRISSDAIWAGLRQVRWPGRCEWIEGPAAVLLDAAHNPSAARALAAYLVELKQSSAYDRLHLVFGVLGDKDLAGMAEALYPLADTLIATEPPSPRALPGDALPKAASAPADCSVVEEPNAAIDRALQAASPGDLVCVTGSIYLIGAVRPRLVVNGDEA